MSDAVIHRMMDAVEQIVLHRARWSKEYRYDPVSHAFVFAPGKQPAEPDLTSWFAVPHWGNNAACTIL